MSFSRSRLLLAHSSDLKTLEEIFGVFAPGGGFLGDANTPGTDDLSPMFVGGAVVPEPSSAVLLVLGIGGIAGLGRVARRGRDRAASADFTFAWGRARSVRARPS